MFRAAGVSDAVVGVTDYLARINGLLLAFNIVPALPLDGGRILHALLWLRTGDKTWATMAAARAGRAFAFLLIAIGLLSLLTGSGIGAIWFAFLGWFLLHAVTQEVSSAQLEQAVAGLRVRDLMVPDPVSVAPGRASRSSAAPSPAAAPMAPTRSSTTAGSPGSCPPARRRPCDAATVPSPRSPT